MPFKCITAEEIYSKDSNLKKGDVQILQEWLKKQPHLPKLEEAQVAMALHSCYYQIEATKNAIDNYYTVRSQCPDVFVALPPDVVQLTASVGLITALPTKTPDGNVVMLLKLIDSKVDNFNSTNLVNLAMMVALLHLHQEGISDGAVAIIDIKGVSLGHVAKLNMNAIKHALYFVQEGVPVRIKGIHIINSIPLVDKIVALLKPFLKSELYNMIQFHPPHSDTLYRAIPKKCLPEDYGGELPSSPILNEQSLKNILDNYDFYKWHDNQKVDESKRVGKSKIVNEIFGVDGTFKKLEID